MYYVWIMLMYQPAISWGKKPRQTSLVGTFQCYEVSYKSMYVPYATKIHHRITRHTTRYVRWTNFHYPNVSRHSGCTHSMSVESGRALEVLEAELAEEDLGETSEVRRVGGRVPHTHLVAAKLHQTKSIVAPSLSSSSSPLEYIGCGEYGKQRPYKSHDHKEKETHQHLLGDSPSFFEEIEVSGGGVAL